jgi:hypothetical protein
MSNGPVGLGSLEGCLHLPRHVRRRSGVPGRIPVRNSMGVLEFPVFQWLAMGWGMGAEWQIRFTGKVLVRRGNEFAAGASERPSRAELTASKSVVESEWCAA